MMLRKATKARGRMLAGEKKRAKHIDESAFKQLFTLMFMEEKS